MPMNRADYPKNWEEISLNVRQAAGWKCQQCGIRQGALTAKAARTFRCTAKVVLTVAHLGETKHNKHDVSNLAALCQSCHLAEDRTDHNKAAAETRRHRKIDPKQTTFGGDV